MPRVARVHGPEPAARAVQLARVVLVPQLQEAVLPGEEEAGGGARDAEHVGRRHAGGRLHPPPHLLRLDTA